jgi:ABC-type transporter Mla subunit MlaD
MTLSAAATARIAFAALLAAGAAAYFAWTRLEEGRFDAYRVRTHDAVSGLIPDAPVELHGVEVGTVERVELVDARTVDVLLRLRRGTPVTQGTLATITSRGLATRGFTGYVYVALEDDGSDARPLAAAAVPLIRAAPARTVSLDTTISRVDENVRQLSALLQGLLDAQTVASLKASAEHLQGVSRTLAANSARLDTILANTERATGVLDARTVRAVRRSVAHLEALSATLASNNERLATIMANAEQASGQLRPLLQSSQDALAALQHDVIPGAHDALAGLESLSSTLKETTLRIERDPAFLLQGRARPAPGPGEAR